MFLWDAIVVGVGIFVVIMGGSEMPTGAPFISAVVKWPLIDFNITTLLSPKFMDVRLLQVSYDCTDLQKTEVGCKGPLSTFTSCPDEDAWLYHKWNLEVDVDSLLQAILPPGPVEDEVDTYEALALAGRGSELSNMGTPEHSDFVIS